MATRQEDLYAEDFYAWTQDQAAALRRLAKERWNGPLDLDHQKTYPKKTYYLVGVSCGLSGTLR